jgi:chitin disaccharide deacetylase
VSKQVIITGDDFGLAIPVNEAIELAHREGVLTTTSLLVGEAAAADAAARAHRNPGLRVGLHVAVCDGRPTLPPSEIPSLVNARGELRHPIDAMLQLLVFGWLPSHRRELEAEIRAQFEAFRALRLTPDHVNGHNNMQLHPVVLPVLMKVAHEYGVGAIRLPYEPLMASWRAARHSFLLRLCVWLVMRPWAAYVKRRLRRAGFVINDYLFGVFDCGALDQTLMERIIENLPEGLSEIHCHPATKRCAELDKTMPRYGHEAEFRALIHPRVREALAASGAQSIHGFGGARGGPAPVSVGGVGTSRTGAL